MQLIPTLTLSNGSISGCCTGEVETMRKSSLLAGTTIALLSVGVTVPVVAQDAAMIEAAKKEGRLAYYTTRQIDAMNAFSRAFEAKYGIKVEASRHTNEDLIG